MKTSIFFILWVLTWSVELWASPIKGIGHSPKVGINSSLGRMLATWDAVSDALIKSQGTLNSSLSMQHELIKSHLITFQHDLDKIQILERTCDILQDEVRCEVLIEIEADFRTLESNRLVFNECTPQKLGLHFCYTKESIEHQITGLGTSTELVLRLQIRWGLSGGEHILFSELLKARGLGKTESRSVRSGILQARVQFLRESVKWDRIYSSYIKLRLVEIPRVFEKKFELYLKMMGTHSFNIREKRFLLVPVFIQILKH